MLSYLVDSIDLHKIMMRGGGGDPNGRTLGLVPIGLVDQCMPTKKPRKNPHIFFYENVRVRPPSASAEYIKPCEMCSASACFTCRRVVVFSAMIEWHTVNPSMVEPFENEMGDDVGGWQCCCGIVVE